MEEFYEDLNNFLIPGDDILQRFIYAGPVYFNICFVDEPQLPESYMPENYPLKKIIDLLKYLPDEAVTGIRTQYKEIDK